LRITADNEYILYLDGQSWAGMPNGGTSTNMTSPPCWTRKHVLAVDAYNSSREAGFMFGMQVGLTTGPVVRVNQTQAG